MKKDIVTKDIIKEIAKDIATYLLNVEIKGEIYLIDKEFTRVEKRDSDIVFKYGNKQIIHIEIQNNHHSKMHLRMLRYYSDILFEYEDYAVSQYVIYIGKDKCRMKDNVNRDKISFNYGIFDIRAMDCEQLLYHSNPAAIALSILCNFKNKDTQVVVNTILTRLRELTKNDDKEYKNYLEMINILSSNRDLEDEVKKGADMLSVDIEKTPFYQKGLETGIERGIEKNTIMIAKQMLKANIDIKDISKFTNLPIEKILKL